MFTKTFTTAVVALAASSLVSAQTYTDCNPLKKDCPADPAFGNDKVDCDFTAGKCDAFHDLDGTTMTYDSNGAVFTINKGSDAPTMATSKYIFFGRIDVEVQAAAGKGIVTSCVLQSDDLDEIDWEWVGGDDTQAQSNYFSKGDTSTYDRGAYHTVSNPLTSFHTYSVEWTPAAIEWIIDGNTVRTLTYDDAKGGSTFPQTPMQIKLGTWVAGLSSKPEGTVEWAGGLTDFSDAPFHAYYKSIKITDYAGTSGPVTTDVEEYTYGDKTGTYKSIDIKDGDSSSDSESTTKESKTATKTATKTKSQSKTKSTEEATTSATKTKSAATTMSTATTEGSNSTITSATASTSAPKDTSATTSAPAKVTDNEGAAPRAIANVVLAGAGLFMAQLLL